MKKSVKKFSFKKAIVSNLTSHKTILGGRDGRTISGHIICESHCPCSERFCG